ncbi:tRNA(Ile)-lysidine synthase [Comamonas sp. BIGb0124]|nr:tRNA(Ile)-lysidine synthase [Comamonas sp. BIGb0124]
MAYSGGADSTALLCAAARHWAGPLIALHVHHGLQAAADGFEHHCRERCLAWGIPFDTQRVDARHAVGQSPEEIARQVRYATLALAARRADAGRVVLAQHADDQIETLLLALSRGAGLAGLAAMPARFERHGMVFERPLLALTAAEIRSGLQAQGLDWIEDPTNRDTGYTRNRIRLQLLPVLEQVFPGFRTTFARSAAHAAQGQDLLDELARADLAEVGCPPRIAALQGLTQARQANVLRHWLKQQGGRSGSAAQLEALLRQVAACTTRGHRIHLKVGQGHVVREGPCLAWQAGPL